MVTKLTKTEKLGYLFLIIVFTASLYFGFYELEYFDTGFSVEDGPVEWGTAIMLFSVSILCFTRLITMLKTKKGLWLFGTLIFALLFLFAAGEEISWGQRIFNIESGEFFKENNAQGETNLHNLVVEGKKINKIIFSQLLMLVMVMYLIVSPILFRKKTWFKNLANSFAVPIVKWHHTIAFLLSTFMVAINPSGRKWEVYELAFGVIFFLIFLNPFNYEIFRKDDH